MSTPNLGMPNVPTGTLEPSVPLNDALQLLDAVVQLAVEDKDLTAPPTTVSGDVGKRWIVGGSATGAWTGHDAEIALCTGADLWRYFDPKEGWVAHVSDENLRYEFDGSAWGVVGSSAAVIPIGVACSDESTALTTGTGKVTFRMPYAFNLSGVRASLSTAQASGSIFTVDINEGGTTILSTKLTIDNAEKTSTTAATPAVISDSSLADDAEITVDIDQVGDGTAKGLKVWLIGTKI